MPDLFAHVDPKMKSFIDRLGDVYSADLSELGMTEEQRAIFSGIRNKILLFSLKVAKVL